MYNSIQIANKIKEVAKNSDISVKTMLAEIDLGVNTLQHMKTSMPKADTLARIADYLGVSVDYLLGRNDNINISNVGNNNKNSPTIITSGNNTISISQNMRIPPVAVNDRYSVFSCANDILSFGMFLGKISNRITVWAFVRANVTLESFLPQITVPHTVIIRPVTLIIALCR